MIVNIVRPSCFTVSSLVLKKDFTRRKRRGGKLDFRWQGHYVITKALGRGLYELKEQRGEKVLVYSVYHIYAM